MTTQHEKNWLPQKVAVIGAGISGLATLTYLQSKGCTLFLSDSGKRERIALSLQQHNLSPIEFEADQHTEKILEYDLIVLSPGVPKSIPLLRKAEAQGIAIWSEIELAYRQSVCTWLAITGSSGKSTTTSMVGSIFQAAGKEHKVVGNIGIPAVTNASTLSDRGFAIAEISSFQLESIDLFAPKVAGITNFLKNHLDRYDSESDYYNAKKNIIQRMDQDDILVVNGTDPLHREWVKDLNGRVRVEFFASCKQDDASWYFENDELLFRKNGNVLSVMRLSTLSVRGIHNYVNAAMAAALSYAAGIEIPAIVRGLQQFTALHHRLEYITTVNGVRCYNDSKSTTAESIHYAIAAFDTPVHLIAGGRDKMCDFTILRDIIRKHVKTITLIGEAADRMESQLTGTAEIFRASSLESAVDMALAHADESEILVLSPGCASFDMFRDYQHRGDSFAAYVRSLSLKSEGI